MGKKNGRTSNARSQSKEIEATSSCRTSLALRFETAAFVRSARGFGSSRHGRYALRPHASSDSFAHYMNVEQATDWASEFERAGSAPHIFSDAGQGGSAAEDTYG